MSLSEYRSPVVKKPKFGWQRYQFGNKSAAELKLSLWDANLSEVVLQNQQPSFNFPLTTELALALDHFNVPTGPSKSSHYASMQLVNPINNLSELVKFLNTRFPFLGEFRPENVSQNILLVVDSTWARATFDDETGSWKFGIAAL